MRRMALLEISYTGRRINMYLAECFPERTRDSIQSRRLAAPYRLLMGQLLAERRAQARPRLLAVASPSVQLPEQTPGPQQPGPSRTRRLRKLQRSLATLLGQLPSLPSSFESEEEKNEEIPVARVSHTEPASPTRKSTSSHSSTMSDVFLEEPSILIEPNSHELSMIADMPQAPRMGADPVLLYLARLRDQWEGWNAEDISVFTALYLATPRDKTQLDVALTALLRTIIPNGRKSPVAKKNKSKNRPVRKGRVENYKRFQSLFDSSREQLASHIFDNKSLSQPDTNPSVEAVETKYRGLFQAPSPPDLQPINRIEEEFDDWRPLTVEEVQWALNTTKSSAAGPDKLTVGELRRQPIQRLTLVLNSCFVLGKFPAVISDSRTILLPKEGNPRDVDSWRPITISSVVVRLCNKIIAKRLSSRPLHPNQRGFRAVDGVFLNTLTLENLIKSRRANVKPYHLLFLDLAKAFDTVSHNSIERALRRFNVDPRMRGFIMGTYSNATTKIHVGGATTSALRITRGVKQGDPLSPILFNMVIDELICELEESHLGLPISNTESVACLGYADDLMLASDTFDKCQRLLRRAGEFFERRGLKLNPQKSVALAVRLVPGKKVLFASTIARFYVEGTPLRQLSPTELAKFLTTTTFEATIRTAEARTETLSAKNISPSTPTLHALKCPRHQGHPATDPSPSVSRSDPIEGKPSSDDGDTIEPPASASMQSGLREERDTHVLQGCPLTHWHRIRRHDRVASRFKALATKRGWSVEEEPRFRLADGALKKSDLLMVKGDCVAVVDVAIPWEGPRSLESAFTQKVDYYSEPAMLEQLRGRYPGKQIIVSALVIGARGTWCSSNDRISRLLLLSPGDVSSLLIKRVAMPQLSEVQRGQIVALLEEGLSRRGVARRFGIHHSVVSRTWARYQETGNLHRRRGSGPSRITTQREDRRIVHAARRNPVRSAHLIGADVHLNRRVSDQTVRRRLHEAELRSRARANVPHLTDRHRQERLRYANDYGNWTARRWRNVLFTDESRFCLFHSDARVRVWRRRGQRLERQCVNPRRAFNGGSVMVWGGVSYDHRTDLVIIPRPGMTALRYIREVLRPHVLPMRRRMGRRFVFMQDNARPHTAQVTRNFFEDNNVEVIPHPAVSPDLNPIEHVWGIMGRHLRQLVRPPTTLDELSNELRAEDLANLRKSGTEKQYDEKERLLQEVKDLSWELQHKVKRAQQQDMCRQKGIKARGDAVHKSQY
ncbi:hypothetical protein ILUMI_25315 [Ignelater luminosus]|uniref:Reverse transcriptase domain-containing protein n=1 Tax=Ignelater luminosus TaxID=2038154 RepID=A0A8K0FWA4_IGNLU|nr:hypothetical protein ILUMI_25315 [Ignelater luminosus]